MSERNQADTQPFHAGRPNAAGTQPIRAQNGSPAQPAVTPPAGDTQPVVAGASRPAGKAQAGGRKPAPGMPPGAPVPPQRKTPLGGVASRRPLPPWLAWALLAALLGGLFVAGGALAGYQAGQQARQAQAGGQDTLQEQYQLALQDVSAGRYEVARQRLEYILSQNPVYPGASDKLVQVMQVLFATATPTRLPPTITPTPTRDPRPSLDLLAQAKALALQGNWSGAIDTLSGLRKADPSFQTAQVDRLLYLALRSRGVDKILKENDLEGGTYDLALAERIGPLDVTASAAREWARLYLYGSSFWEALPEQAVYYFSQVAAAAPSLRDGSGWTASARYWAALIQYGDWLGKKGDWCAAQQQYALALGMQGAANVEATAAYAAEQCAGTPTPTPQTETPTLTPTLTGSPTTTAAPATATLTPESSSTATAPAATATEAASPTATTSEATTPAPTATPASPSPTSPPATETPSPEPSATPQPPSATPAPPTANAPTSAATQANPTTSTTP
ncbi:MAG TPA: hypothetical protein VF498_02165 [Anaerolineales bacterium]